MRLGESELRRCRIARGGRIKGLAGRDPEPAVAVEMAIPAVGADECRRELDGRGVGMENSEEARCEGELVTFTRKRHGLERTRREKSGKIILPVERAHLSDEPFL